MKRNTRTLTFAENAVQPSKLKRAKRISINRSIYVDRFRLKHYIKTINWRSRWRDQNKLRDRDGYEPTLSGYIWRRSHSRYSGAKDVIRSYRHRTRQQIKNQLNQVVKMVRDPQDVDEKLFCKADPWDWD